MDERQRELWLAKPFDGRTVTLEWREWWAERSIAERMAPFLAVLFYWGALLFAAGPRHNELVMGLAYLGLYYAGPRLRPIYNFVLPFLLTGVIYDGQRYYSQYLRGTIHIAEPYQLEKRLFGISTTTGTLIPNEWLQLHTHWLLDFFSGLAYLFYIAQFMAVGAFFYFFRKPADPRLEWLRRSIPWAFLIVNVLGYLTYHLYPAAPPWYVSLHGFAPVGELSPNPAGAARFDALFGTSFFVAMYGESANALGAIPSLHAAYPVLAVYYAHRFGALRVFCWSFFLLICFSAVYLNHHYVIDVILGALYAAAVAAVLELGSRRNQDLRARTRV